MPFQVPPPFPTLPSTNRWAREHIDEISTDTVILADQQTGGYGRHGRVWVSPAGKNLYMSLVLRPKVPIHMWSGMTQVAAITLGQLLEGMGVPAQVKWPNDLLWNEHKICGMLAEVSGAGKTKALILGIGLNVNSDPEDFIGLDRKAASLKIILGRELDREMVLGAMLKAFEAAFQKYCEDGLKPFLEQWRSMRNFLGHKARAVLADRTVVGTLQSIDVDGSLKFLADSGELLSIYSGDVEI